MSVNPPATLPPSPKNRTPTPGPPTSDSLFPRIFAGLFGAFLGLSLLKFGNPPIMEKWVTPPQGFYQFLFGYPWPMSWAYMLLGIIAVAGLVVAKWKAPYRRWLVLLPLAWLVWELIASTQSVDEQLTKLTLKHFIACIVCFYLGQRSLHQRLWPFWLGLLTGLLLVLAIGLDQHFGGTEQSRRYFYGQLAL